MVAGAVSVNVGSLGGKTVRAKGRGLKSQVPVVKPGAQRATRPSVHGPREYTDEDADTLAWHVVALALDGDDTQIGDYRHLRGIGADALKGDQFIEHKRFAREPDDTITLTANEVERALKDPSRFLLAVVSGLEEGFDTEVRFIPRPLEALDVHQDGGLRLTGVRSKQAVQVTFHDV
jgi:hypothetical protein